MVARGEHVVYQGKRWVVHHTYRGTVALVRPTCRRGFLNVPVADLRLGGCLSCGEPTPLVYCSLTCYREAR